MLVWQQFNSSVYSCLTVCKLTKKYIVLVIMCIKHYKSYCCTVRSLYRDYWYNDVHSTTVKIFWAWTLISFIQWKFIQFIKTHYNNCFFFRLYHFSSENIWWFSAIRSLFIYFFMRKECETDLSFVTISNLSLIHI